MGVRVWRWIDRPAGQPAGRRRRSSINFGYPNPRMHFPHQRAHTTHTRTPFPISCSCACWILGTSFSPSAARRRPCRQSIDRSIGVFNVFTYK